MHCSRSSTTPSIASTSRSASRLTRVLPGMQVEQAQPRQAGRIEQAALQKLPLQHGELIRRHFPAIRFQLLIQRATCLEERILGGTGAQARDHLFLDRSEPLFELFEV